MAITPKVGVFGAGAIGSFFGALLAKSLGPGNVVLVGRGGHAEAVRNSGRLVVHTERLSEEIPVRMENDPAALEGADYILLTVKSQATQEAVAQLAPYVGKAAVVAIQNGICDHLLERSVPRPQLVAGVTAINVHVAKPGCVELQLGGYTILGPMFPEAIGAAQDAARLLAKTQMPVRYEQDVHKFRYSKLGINAVGYVSCLSASNFITDCLLYRRWRQQVAVPLLREIVDVYRVAGIRTQAIPGRPDVDTFRKICRLLDIPGLGTVLSAFMRKSFNRRPIVFSLYQDLVAGKNTEVDFINGEIVRLASQRGVACPLNRLVVQMVHELESKTPRQFFTRDEVISRFAAQRRVASGNMPPLAE